MNSKDNKTVGELVKENFSSAKVFKKYGIDFCCHGHIGFAEACANAGVSADEVAAAIDNDNEHKNGGSIPFAEWPLDLLLDYVLKIHHRNIRKKGPELLSLIAKVKNAHGDRHPELNELHALVEESLEDLEMHLRKEENVLFPFLYELFEASENRQKTGRMHCGSINNPINVMHMEHANEGNRYLHIKELTNNFQTPQDGCASYRLMMQELEEFVDGLFEHIHLENNIIFPAFIELEEKWID